MKTLNRWLVATLVASACGASFASPLPMPIFNSVGIWETSQNGVDGWVPAVAVANPFTTPVAVHNLFDNNGQPRGTEWRVDPPLGQFMWHPDVNGVRPLQAWFRLSFTYDALQSDFIGAWFAADDYAEMTLNGVPVTSYLLDSNKDVYGQPIPKLVSFDRGTGLTTKFDPWGDGVGLNTVLIRAQDGDANSAYNRELAWVLVDGNNIGQILPDGQVAPPYYLDGFALVSSGKLPEPSALGLTVLALLAAAGSVRVRRRT